MLLSIMVIYYNIGSTDFTMVSLSEISPRWSTNTMARLLPILCGKNSSNSVSYVAASSSRRSSTSRIYSTSWTIPKTSYIWLPPNSYWIHARCYIILLTSCTNYCNCNTNLHITGTLRQVDFKALVAYSSISHIAIVVLGLFSNTIVGIEGAISLSLLMELFHLLCSH